MAGFLTKKQRVELREEPRLGRKARYSDRIKCILLLDQGESERAIAKFLFLSLGSVRNYRKRYEEGGVECLVDDDYLGSMSYLSSEELSALSKH